MYVEDCDNVVEKDLKKGVEYFLRADKKGVKFASTSLASIYEDKETPFYDVDKAVDIYLKLLPDSYAHKKLLCLINSNRVSWRKDVHKFWMVDTDSPESQDNKIDLNKQIITLLLVSKKRKSSTLPYIVHFVSGISLVVIKYLCNFRKVKCE